MKAAFQNLRTNAKRRGKMFDLTFEEFKRFCIKTSYLTGKGKSRDSFSIDRKRNWIGYTADNIQVLTLAENSRKKFLDYDWESKTARVIEVRYNQSAQVPF